MLMWLEYHHRAREIWVHSADADWPSAGKFQSDFLRNNALNS